MKEDYLYVLYFSISENGSRRWKSSFSDCSLRMLSQLQGISQNDSRIVILDRRFNPLQKNPSYINSPFLHHQEQMLQDWLLLILCSYVLKPVSASLFWVFQCTSLLCCSAPGALDDSHGFFCTNNVLANVFSTNWRCVSNRMEHQSVCT